MKYGVVVTITQTEYIEVEADCEEEAKAKAAEELNAELYEKVSAEFEKYTNNLLVMSPEQMLEHAYAYAIRSGVVALEYHELRARRVRPRRICCLSPMTDEKPPSISDLSTRDLEITKTVRSTPA